MQFRNQVSPRTILNGHSYGPEEIIQHPTTNKLYFTEAGFATPLSLTAAQAADAAIAAGKAVLLGTLSA